MLATVPETQNGSPKQSTDIKETLLNQATRQESPVSIVTNEHDLKESEDKAEVWRTSQSERSTVIRSAVQTIELMH